VIHVLVSFHAVFALVLLSAEPADERLVSGAVLVQVMPLEVAEMLDHLSTEQALVSVPRVAHRQLASNEKNLVAFRRFGHFLTTIGQYRQ